MLRDDIEEIVEILTKKAKRVVISTNGYFIYRENHPKKYVFTASRFVPKKGLYDLIEAYRAVKNPDFEVVIAGDADHETDYLQRKQ